MPPAAARLQLADAAAPHPLGQPGPRAARRPRPAGKEEGGAALPARAPPTTQAAGISGPGPRHSAPLRRQREALLATACFRGSEAAPRGSGSRCEKWGETSWIDRRRRRTETGAGLERFPRLSLRVERSRRFPLSLPPHREGSWGLPARLPASPPGRAPPPGSAHVGGRGFCADARAQDAPASSLRLHCLYGNFSGVEVQCSKWDYLQRGGSSEQNSSCCLLSVP